MSFAVLELWLAVASGLGLEMAGFHHAAVVETNRNLHDPPKKPSALECHPAGHPAHQA